MLTYHIGVVRPGYKEIEVYPDACEYLLRRFNRGFFIFFNIEKLLFQFIKFFFEIVRWDAPPPERPKIWHARRRGYLIFYLSYA